MYPSVIETQLKKASTSGDATSDASTSEWVSEGWNRDKGRAYIKDRLVADQGGRRGRQEIPDVLDLADHAFAKQVRIENWPDSMAADGRFPKQGFQQTAFSTSDLKEIIPPLEKAQGNPKYEDDSTVKVEKCLRVMEWTEDERNLPQAEQGDVPLVVSVKGNVLVKVANSKKFVAKTGTAVRQTKPRARALTQEWPRKRARDEEPLPTSPEPAGSSSPGPLPTKRISFRAQRRFGRGPAKPGASRHAAAPACQPHQGYPKNAEAGPSRRPAADYYDDHRAGPPYGGRAGGGGYSYGYRDDTRAGAGMRPGPPYSDYDNARYRPDRYHAPEPHLHAYPDQYEQYNPLPPLRDYFARWPPTDFQPPRRDYPAEVTRPLAKKTRTREDMVDDTQPTHEDTGTEREPSATTAIPKAEKRRLKALAEGYLSEGRVLGCLKVGSEKSAWMSRWIRDCPDDERSKADKHTEIDDGGVYRRLTSGRFEPEGKEQRKYYETCLDYKRATGKGRRTIGLVMSREVTDGVAQPYVEITGSRIIGLGIGWMMRVASGKLATMPRTPRTPSTSTRPKASGREGRLVPEVQPSITLYHKLFHITCYQADDHAHWLMLTDLELTRGFRLAEWGGPTEPELCTKCHRVVPLYGFARYCACHLWAPENINNEYPIVAPQCICPGESNTPDCPFHSVAPAAQQLVPPGASRFLPVVYRFNRIGGIWGEPGSTFDELAAAISAWCE
ncbi:hypothetical protein B0H13DRAFT_1923596 [Mycena leptocephala]|nr:hypothetical protein B0H13DRAFT_1923596 [Mycena leptocephala]